MDYRTGNATDQHDLLGKIKVLLEDNGWIINMYQEDDFTYNSSVLEQSADAMRLHAYKNSHYLNFRSTTGAVLAPIYSNYRQYGIFFSMGTGFSATDEWHEQPGVPQQRNTDAYYAACLTLNTSCEYTLFYFDDPFTLLVYISYGSNVYGQMYFGEINTKYGSWNGGELFLSSISFNRNTSYSGIDSKQSFLSPKLSITNYGNNIAVADENFKGALRFTTDGILPEGCTWATHCGYDTTDYADDLLIPFLGFPTSYFGSYSGVYKTSTNLYCLDMHGPLFYQSMPPAIPGPLLVLPVQPCIYRDGTSRISMIGELPHIKITCAAPEAVGENYIVGDTTYKIMPLGSPSVNSSGYYVNPMLAVEFDA